MTELAEKRKREAIETSKQAEIERQAIVSASFDLSITMMRAAGIKGKAIALASAIINTAKAVTQVLPNIPLAAIIAAKGAAEVAIISAQKMAKGGIVTAPTLVLAGEAGPEAIVPLTDRDRGVGGALVFRGEINVATADKMSEMTDSEIDDMLEKQLLPGLDRLARRGITVTS